MNLRHFGVIVVVILLQFFCENVVAVANNLSSNVRPGEGLTSFDIDNTGEKSTLKLSGVSML